MSGYSVLKALLLYDELVVRMDGGWAGELLSSNGIPSSKHCTVYSALGLWLD